MIPIPDKLAKNEYYHGTSSSNALQILYEGFRLKNHCSSYNKTGTFKQGLYLTKTLSVATLFGHDYVFKCNLEKGVSVLWLDGNYDPTIITYLKKEFSKRIITEPISKAIPHNKNLTKKELIHLLNYRFSMASWKTRKDAEKWAANISSFRQQLMLHKYDGVGETEVEIGVVIFNPSFVKPVELFNVISRGGENVLKPLNPQKLNTDIDLFCKDMEEFLDFKHKTEMDHVRSLQERFKRENGLV